jgi:hypothetical protein
MFAVVIALVVSATYTVVYTLVLALVLSFSRCALFFWERGGVFVKQWLI